VRTPVSSPPRSAHACPCIISTTTHPPLQGPAPSTSTFQSATPSSLAIWEAQALLLSRPLTDPEPSIDPSENKLGLQSTQPTTRPRTKNPCNPGRFDLRNNITSYPPTLSTTTINGGVVCVQEEKLRFAVSSSQFHALALLGFLGAAARKYSFS
jgi:hypothetical protein